MDEFGVLSVGTVKSFSVQKGYGFLNDVADCDEDVRFMREDLPGQLYLRHDLKGVQLRFKLVPGNGGKFSATDLSTLETPTFTSVVKSYNAQKGFGFIARPAEFDGTLAEGMKDDVFMAQRNFVVDRLADAANGKLIAANTEVMFSVQQGPQGLQAQHIRFPHIEKQFNVGATNLLAGVALRLGQPSAAVGIKRQRTADPDTGRKRRRPDSDTVLCGRVTSFQKGKYGFIASPDLDEEIFFPDDGKADYKKGDVMEFFVGVDSATNKLRASEFRKAPTGTLEPKRMPAPSPMQQRAGSPFTVVQNNLRNLNLQELVEINSLVGQLMASQAAGR